MSETQRVYSRLVDKMPEELATRELESFLFDVSSGTNAFNLRTQETGDSVMSAVVEWTRWFEFLLPSLIERSHEPVGFHTLGEQTVTAVFHFFPDDLDVYAGFRDDARAMSDEARALSLRERLASLRSRASGQSSWPRGRRRDLGALYVRASLPR